VLKCDCPKQWANWRKLFIKALQYHYKIDCYHYVVEWQRRQTPHLHMAVFSGGEYAAGFASSGSSGILADGDYAEWHKSVLRPAHVVQLWRDIVGHDNAAASGQYVVEIDQENMTRWLRYQSKHASRGITNYQRDPANIPPKWKGETGRVWGKGGNWPTREFKTEGLSQDDKYRIRRLWTKLLSKNPDFLQVPANYTKGNSYHWRRWRKCNKRMKSRMRSPSSFIPLKHQIMLAKAVNPDCYIVDEETGEIFQNYRDIGLAERHEWRPPLAPQTDMSDILGFYAAA